MVAQSGFAPGADIVLDFSRVQTLSGATLGKLVRLHNALKNLGHKLVLGNVTDEVLEILQVTGLTRVFTIHARNQHQGQPDNPRHEVLQASRVQTLSKRACERLIVQRDSR